MSDLSILVVGAGGIGCEVVKCLAIKGYLKITVIDFDTVSLSNLSRQFFYSENDIGESKARVLALNVTRLFPTIQIMGLTMDVLSNDFNLSFIGNFNFVFCAVDNISAREKVNKLCVFSNKPLIDCASSGRFAQSIPIFPFITSCFSCTPTVEPTGPKITCTIRSTPESYEHCAAWAFHLFNAMYSNNESTDVVTISPNVTPFHYLFVDRILDLQKNEGMWKTRTPPTIIENESPPNAEPISRPTDVWSDDESVSVFKYLSTKLNPPLTFDKDNIEHLAFTTSAANLQALSFHINRMCSMFDAKGLVSVVEPSLSTTNSIISGISVMQMERMLNLSSNNNVKAVWLSHDLNGPRLTPTELEKPNPKCPVCGVEFWKVSCNFAETKCSDIGKFIGAKEPSIVYNGSIIFDPDYPDVDKFLCEVNNLGNVAVLSICDLAEDEKNINVLVLNSVNKEVMLVKKAEKVNEIKNLSEDEYSDIIEIV
ncbi:ubiquitin-like 1-activating enzyme E1 B [Histomonas meleagridis]|uniref:ubiquitin-like 1-activating enzyme E1 B n=1 Tax=Histomonas meleagridis TaxID=135588 RepID=UPI00355A157C|nr:ubiquitin-like 1-activating enzyme E1 B [Histomonas meleagridis]KAH0799186.1 ubiquitin-like 1-activating enzyme E1 B [Histomonas meleagridis]